MDRPLIIASRRSPLARLQAREVADLIAHAHGWNGEEMSRRIRIDTFVSEGDVKLSGPLAAVGGKGLFTKEIQGPVLAGDADIAVHSLKDMPTASPEGLVVGPTPRRADPRDCFISPKAKRLEDLPAGATVGAAALRRTAQVLHRRPDLKVATIRGAVQTRLRKLNEGEVDATFLAAAGLTRMGFLDKASSILSPDEMLPAIGQGALGIEYRAGDDRIAEALSRIGCPETGVCVAAERAFLAALDGSCRAPIAGLARRNGREIVFDGEVLSPDGQAVFKAKRTFVYKADDLDSARAAGEDAAAEIRAAAGPAFFDALKA